MIRISQLKLPVDHTEKALAAEIARRAYGQQLVEWKIVRRSIDARKKPELFYTYTIDAAFDGEKKVLQHRNSKWSRVKEERYRFLVHADDVGGGQRLPEEERPVIIGAGPAGLFAALVLARNGFAPVVYERGDAVELRTKKVEHFFKEGVLDTESNVQFGEGGAGTFSDGKLNTVVKDKSGKNRFVLEEFVKHGAPEEILYEAKPHIGTDILKRVVASIREEILSLGGEIHFGTKLVELLTEEKDGERMLTGIRLETAASASGNNAAGVKVNPADRDEKRHIIEKSCRTVILAVGHSARDTFYMLYDKGLFMRPKSFAIGVRVEHPAAMINESQYGEKYAGILPAASYKLTHQCKNGRGVYSFCMCPGGYVVNSSSEEGLLCVNGMSDYKRDSANSNSAIITTVTPEDFALSENGTTRAGDPVHPLAGVEFQRQYEKLAYASAGGKIPLQLYGDFKEGKVSTGFGGVTPCMKGQWQFADVRKSLPDYVAESLIEGIEAFGHKIKGYDRPDAIFSGVETRTSSPVRMERDESGQANIRGLFPCGEGAGYAGGITSAAMDGLRMAEAAARKLSKIILF